MSVNDINENSAIELNADEMEQAAGGADRYKPLTARDGFVVYRIRSGDTLSKIAAAHKCTVNDLLRWNSKITNPNQIYANEFIYIRK